MPLVSLVNHIKQNPLTKELLNRTLREDKLLIKGGNRVAKALITTSLAKLNNSPLLVIVPTLEEASRWYSLLNTMGWEKLYLYPTSEISPYEVSKPTNEISWGQLQVLSDLVNLSDTDSLAIVTTERALEPHLPDINNFKSTCITIQQGLSVKLEELSLRLSSLGYKRDQTTEQEGTWSRRGDIIDIYPVSHELPIRIELFGDQVEKIKEFDPITQRSLEQIDEVVITPTSLVNIIEETLQKKDLIKEIETMEKSTNAIINNIDVNNGISRFIGLAWENVHSITNYLPVNSFVVVDELNLCKSHSKEWITYVNDSFEDFTSNLPDTLKNEQTLNDLNFIKGFPKNYLELNKFKGLDISQIDDNQFHKNRFDLICNPIQSIPNQFGKISLLIKQFQKEYCKVWITSAQPTRAVALLEEHECITKFIPNNNDHNSIKLLIEQNTPIALKLTGTIDIEGISLGAWKVSLITDREFFGQQLVSSGGYIRRRRSSSNNKVNPSKLNPGDYVVHRNHGVGKFLKIEKLILNSQSRDYLLVKYEDGTLRVAADQLGSLGRYRNSTDKPPRINKLGGTSWNRIKEKAKKAIDKVAIDLIKLYAERLNKKGFSHPQDGPWQGELEEAFPYEATLDQLKAVKEVKKDMENVKPMDRLVCGDVGFGKTEVAIRAIFKSVTAGKQAALLSPTTILSQQHWRTLSERYAPYPIKVSLLNRFKTIKERKQIVEDLKNGKIDVIVATHTLLGKSIVFKNLGLLVVDEEQRFGVKQKERIKELKSNIDVLTLTATPIPRTLYMSLSGVREMSLITTPPPLRRPIKSHLTGQDDDIIRSAISQEVDRGGQIFYVVPRVEGIEQVALQIKNMIPNLKILIAHGRMDEGELENAMIAFNSGEADLMLCTTIIESGLDIPRVNTIIIENAHQFGLSQLYQLRGRVGRSGVQAHAWLFYPQENVITESAKKRLKAIQQFSELGSGYQLAMRDMEIRGVGNLLGTQQSGQMEAIGFDLYMEILQESISEIQGTKIPIVEEANIDLPVTAFIPADWIIDQDQKLIAYKAASECMSIENLIELTITWKDRYGDIPNPVQALIQVMKLKIKAKQCGISRIKVIKPNIVLETKMSKSSFEALRKAIPSSSNSRFIYKQGDKVAEIVIRGIGNLDVNRLIEQLIEWLDLIVAYIEASDVFD